MRQYWGPFLIVCPNSTLHQWQQEVSKFCPSLRVLPYWGSQQDRALLRKYWTQSSLGSVDSAFHVLVTSYHTVVADAKYFARMRWQYLLCDEAQSLKNAQSLRWKSLLHLKCRNRALLTGTPIQNSMAELWALLHFIMPEPLRQRTTSSPSGSARTSRRARRRRRRPVAVATAAS